MKKTKLFFIAILAIITVSAQQKDTFQLFSGGRKYKKTNVYLLFQEGNGSKKIYTEKGLYFYIGQEQFYHSKKEQEIDSLYLSDFKKIEITNVKNLIGLEYSIYRKKMKEENIKIPQPPIHNILNVYILEPLNEYKFIKYQVDWIFSTQ